MKPTVPMIPEVSQRTVQPYLVLATKTREFYETNIMIVPEVNFIYYY